MAALNPLFARNFVSICKRVLAGDDFPDGPQLWIDALLFYRTSGPANVVRALALMAQAHILVDLPNALFELEKTENIRVNEEQYQAVFDHIIACLNSLDANLVDAESVQDYLISTLAMHFGVVKKARALRIRSLSKAAWVRYERHREFAALQRRDENPSPPAN